MDWWTWARMISSAIPSRPSRRYTVSVATSQTSALPGIPAAAARRIDITVSYAPSGSVTLSGYRTNY